jgi:phosphoribosylformylglycinamidine synthase subunit PurS
MKARVIVQLKEGVLDPQGQTIRRSLNKMGHQQVSEVRQGKYFELEFSGLSSEQAIRQLVEEIARNVLSNPIIESFEIEEIS